MKLSGKIADVSIDYVSGKPKITLAINERNEFMQGFDEIKDRERLSIEIKPYRERRSLNANAYAWKLIGDIADSLRANKEDVYFFNAPKVWAKRSDKRSRRNPFIELCEILHRGRGKHLEWQTVQALQGV